MRRLGRTRGAVRLVLDFGGGLKGNPHSGQSGDFQTAPSISNAVGEGAGDLGGSPGPSAGPIEPPQQGGLRQCRCGGRSTTSRVKC